MKNRNTLATNTLEAHVKRYGSARVDLLIMIVLTVANIVMMFTGSESMMLFSASIPYYLVGSGYWYNDKEMLIFGLVVAAVCLLIYLVCWIMSKKKYQWLIVAAILFAADSAFMAWLYISSGDFTSGIFDIVIHALVLYYLIAGIITGRKLKALKEESSLGEGIEGPDSLSYTDYEENENEQEAENSVYKKRADTDVKFRTLAEAEHNGHIISYRRLKRANELVIDGYVYDEIEMLIETPHVLTAKIDGDLIQAGLKEPSLSFISVNGNIVSKKIRII